MRKRMLMLAIACASLAHAEGNYDPFNSKDPQERENAAHMQDAAEKGDWRLAETFASTDALRRLYAQAKAEAVQPVAGQHQDLLGDPTPITSTSSSAKPPASRSAARFCSGVSAGRCP